MSSETIEREKAFEKAVIEIIRREGTSSKLLVPCGEESVSKRLTEMIQMLDTDMSSLDTRHRLTSTLRNCRSVVHDISDDIAQREMCCYATCLHNEQHLPWGRCHYTAGCYLCHVPNNGYADRLGGLLYDLYDFLGKHNCCEDHTNVRVARLATAAMRALRKRFLEKEEALEKLLKRIADEREQQWDKAEQAQAKQERAVSAEKDDSIIGVSAVGTAVAVRS